MAAAVGIDGHVFAVDVAPQMLDRLRTRLAEAGAINVQCFEGEASSTGLPSGCANVVFMANVWHEFDDHAAVLGEARRLLQPRGRIAILDWRPDAVPDHGPPVAHRIAANAAKASLEGAGLVVHSAGNVGRYSWLLVGPCAASTT